MSFYQQEFLDKLFGTVVDEESMHSCLFIQKRLKFDIRSFLIMFYALCEGHEKVENLIGYPLLKIK